MASTPVADRPARRRRSSAAALAAGVLAVGVLAGGGAGAVALLGDDDAAQSQRGQRATPANKAVVGPAAAPFRLVFPDRWRVVDKASAEWDGSSPVVSLRRDDSSGTVVLRVGGRLEDRLGVVRSELRTALPRRAQARRLTSHAIEVDGGRALLTLWVDGGSANVQTNMVVPSGKVSYVLDAVVAPGADGTAREVGAILGSFQRAAR